MVKPEDKDSSEEDENMNSGPGASTAQAEPASFAEMMARDANLKAGTNTAPPTAILNRDKKASEEAALPDWRFQDEDEYEDPEDEIFLPPSQNFHPNSIDHLDEQVAKETNLHTTAILEKRKEVITIMERLEQIGAIAILEFSINNCRLDQNPSG